MGNQKFNLTNMIPNAWVYKLKHMNKTSKNTTYSMSSSMLKKSPLLPAPLSSPLQLEPQCRSRKSYHITRELTTIDQLKITPPRKSSKSSSKSRKSTRSSTTTSSCSCQSTSTYTTSLSSLSKSRSPPSPPLPLKETDVVKTSDNLGFLVEDALLKIKDVRADDKQSILDHNAMANKKPQHFVHNTNFHLPPIITKQETQHHSKTIKNDKLKPHYIHQDHTNNSTSGRLSVSSPRGLRLKVNSPKIMGRKQQGQNVSKNGGRKSTSLKKKSNIKESFAVVKSSFDPQRDFKESMVEMIVQNNLRATKDLEDLLTCYLSLNSVEYHDVIIKVFKQIWFDFRHPT